MSSVRRFEYYIVSAWLSFLPTAIFAAIAVLVILKVFRIRSEVGIWTTIAAVGLLWTCWGGLSFRASMDAVRESKGRTETSWQRHDANKHVEATRGTPTEIREAHSQDCARRRVPHA
jgi:hypothetical protein